MSVFRQMITPLAAVFALSVGSVNGADIQLSIDPAQPGPIINKNIYGQFAEHLGQGIYEGMWVGPKSKTPNVRGWRKDVVGALKDLQVPLVRWPGGCFADEYHWRDGIGKKRPVKVNTNWGGVEEDNAVGTHEFFDLAEQLGAETYINGNLGSGTPQEMAEWLEYMTSESNSTLAQLRRKNGRDKPFRVNYFAIGNEAWGCGGNMTPEYFASLYNRFATFAKTPADNRPKFIAAGGTNEGDPAHWTDVLTKSIHPNWSLSFDAVSFHYYTLPTGKWDVKGAAIGFPESEWMSTLTRTLRMDEFIISNKKVLDRNDPEKKVGFYVDEWGTWYDSTPGTNPGFLNQQNSLRDAVVAALNFNIFHKHADRVHMTNIAQMVNVLQAMIMTEKDKMILTPTYHAFKMYTPFQDATSLPLTLSNVPNYTLGDQSVAALSASAARAKDGKIYVALVNADPHKAQSLAINVAGMGVASASGQVLTAEVMDAHNSFAKPRAIEPAAYEAKAKNGKMVLTIPAKAVIVVALQ